jgi:hypothetical protein
VLGRVVWGLVDLAVIALLVWAVIALRPSRTAQPFHGAYNATIPTAAPTMPQESREHPSGPVTPLPTVSPVLSDPTGSDDAQDILDEIESVGMPGCGEPISISGADDIEPAYC